MSLKFFHLFFIVLSVLLSFGFGVWCIAFYKGQYPSTYVVTGILSFLAGAGLIVYGRKFLQKIKHIRFQ